MKQVLNFHVLQVKHIPGTNYREPRVKVISERFKQSIYLPYDNDIASGAPALETAIKHLHAKGFNITGKGEGAQCYYLIVDTFLPLKVAK